MLNRYDHEDAGRLRDTVRTVLPVMADLIDRTRSAAASLVYVNDNHGDWTAGRAAPSVRRKSPARILRTG
jgi:hypothetical protein